MADSFPDWRVELALADPPGTATPTWTDVSADVALVEINRGRDRELERFRAGTAQVTLIDQARAYDPVVVPTLRPMRQLRVFATFDAVTYQLFRGFIDSIEHAYEGPREGRAMATIFATDGFKALAAINLPSSAYALEVAGDGPRAWFRLGDAQGSTVYDSVAAIPGTVTNGSLGQPGLIARDDNTAAVFTSTGGVVVTDSRAFVTGSVTQFTFEAVIATTAATTQVILQQDGSDSAQFRLRMLGTGILEFQVSDAGLAYTAETESTGAVNDGQVHHVAASFSTATGLRVWVDGVDVSSVVLTDTGTPVVVATSLTLGNDKSLVVNGWTGTLDEVAVYPWELSVTEISAHAAQVRTPWNGDTPGARLDRLLDYAGWSTGLRTLDAGTSVLQSAELDGALVLDQAQLAAGSDFGALFIAVDGKVRFIGRQALFQKTSQATFGDDPGTPAELGYRSMEPDYTDALIRNDVTVSRVEGVAQRVQDASSITDYLRHTFTLDGLAYNSDTLSRSAAEFLVAEYKDPRRRISSLEILPRGDPTDLFPQVLGRELTDVVTVVDRPAGGGAANTQVSTIEGITHRIGPLAWETEWRLTPAFGSAGVGSVGTWDVSLWDQARWGF